MQQKFEISTHFKNRKTVFHCNGDVTGESDGVLNQAYEELPADKKEIIILDFTETDYINSAGIAVLISIINRAREDGAEIRFCSLSDHFMKVMDIVGLTEFIKIFPGLDEALE